MPWPRPCGRCGEACRDAGAARLAGRWQESASAARALELWRGTPLLDVPSRVLSDQVVPGLEQMCLQAIEDGADADLPLGNHDRLIPGVRVLAVGHPMRERFHAQLIEADYALLGACASLRGARCRVQRSPDEGAAGVDERVRQAGLLYERAVFSGDAGQLAEADRELDAAEAELALARGRLMHTRFLLSRDQDPATAEEDPGELPLFERAARLYRALGDVRGEAEALFWIGCFHQVIRRDNAAAVPVLEQSLERASQATDKAVMSEALRHLGIAAHATGRLEEARQRLEEATRLRRETGHLAGAAANMVGLAYIAAAQHRNDDATALLDEADAIAGAGQAHRILQQVSEARTELSDQHPRRRA